MEYGRGSRTPREGHRRALAPQVRALGLSDPGTCSHARVRRLGVQWVPGAAFRAHLVVCVSCARTISTETLRLRRTTRGPRPGAGGGSP